MKPNILQTGKYMVYGIIFLLSCGKSDSGYSGGGNNNNNPPSGSGNRVSIANTAYSVTNLNVKTGTTVTWTNNDNMLHTVTADDGSFNSGDMKYGDTYSRTFSSAGTYNYHCVHHNTMKAAVVVTQ